MQQQQHFRKWTRCHQKSICNHMWQFYF